MLVVSFSRPDEKLKPSGRDRTTYGLLQRHDCCRWLFMYPRGLSDHLRSQVAKGRRILPFSLSLQSSICVRRKLQRDWARGASSVSVWIFARRMKSGWQVVEMDSRMSNAMGARTKSNEARKDQKANRLSSSPFIIMQRTGSSSQTICMTIDQLTIHFSIFIKLLFV